MKCLVYQTDYNLTDHDAIASEQKHDKIIIPTNPIALVEGETLQDISYKLEKTTVNTNSNVQILLKPPGPFDIYLDVDTAKVWVELWDEFRPYLGEHDFRTHLTRKLVTLFNYKFGRFDDNGRVIPLNPKKQVAFLYLETLELGLFDEFYYRHFIFSPNYFVDSDMDWQNLKPILQRNGYTIYD